MYTLTFNRETISDLLSHRSSGRQFYGAIIIPYSGVFSSKSIGSYVQPPKIVPPYQVNDIVAIQERWARDRDSYVYATDNVDADYGYVFRPAITAPLDSVRIYGRITSIKPWRITKNMAKNYLSRGMSSDSYAGAARVIGYADTGNKLLSSLRNKYNRQVLNKSSQPLVPEDLPMVIKNVPYYLRQPITYMLSYISDSEASSLNPELTQYTGPTSQMAQAYNDSVKILKAADENYQCTLDYRLGDWVWTVKTESQAAAYMMEHQTIKKDGKGLIKRGQYYYDSGTDIDTHQYVYIYTQDGKPIPKWKYYQTEIVDPEQHWFAWMVSGYLCTADGITIGKWF